DPVHEDLLRLEPCRIQPERRLRPGTSTADERPVHAPLPALLLSRMRARGLPTQGPLAEPDPARLRSGEIAPASQRSWRSTRVVSNRSGSDHEDGVAH